jgi:hypothetical protein
VFSLLRTEPLPRAAAALAACGNVAGLAVLLQRHKTSLAPRLLQLLSGLPESLDARTYASLLPRASGPPPPAAAAGDADAGDADHAGAAAPRLGKPVGVGNVHAGLQRKVDWVESEDTFHFLAAAAGSLLAGGAAAAAAATAAAAAERPQQQQQQQQQQQEGLDLLPAPSIDADPGLLIDTAAAAAAAAAGAISSSSGCSSPAGLRLAGSLDMTSYALCPDEATAFVHATEEMERYCCAHGLSKRMPPTSLQVRGRAWHGVLCVLEAPRTRCRSHAH